MPSDNTNMKATQRTLSAADNKFVQCAWWKPYEVRIINRIYSSKNEMKWRKKKDINKCIVHHR